MNPTAFIVICQDKNLAPNIASFQRDVGIYSIQMPQGIGLQRVSAVQLPVQILFRE
jgi:hypothetical protein